MRSTNSIHQIVNPESPHLHIWQPQRKRIGCRGEDFCITEPCIKAHRPANVRVSLPLENRLLEQNLEWQEKPGVMATLIDEEAVDPHTKRPDHLPIKSDQRDNPGFPLNWSHIHLVAELYGPLAQGDNRDAFDLRFAAK